MILSDATIRELLDSGKIVVTPIIEKSIQPASVDLRLGSTFYVVDALSMDHVSMDKEISYRKIETEEITIPPHTFILATTIEEIAIPEDISAFIEGRSSIGRMGLFIQNAGWIDPGFSGHLALQLYNANPLPIKLQTGRRVCQLVFCKMDQSVAKPYAGKYSGKSVTSKVYADND